MRRVRRWPTLRALPSLTARKQHAAQPKLLKGGERGRNRTFNLLIDQEHPLEEPRTVGCHVAGDRNKNPHPTKSALSALIGLGSMSSPDFNSYDILAKAFTKAEPCYPFFTVSD